MGDTGWGITFVLGIGAMVTTVLVTLAIQYFRIRRLKMELAARTPRDRLEVAPAQSE